MSAAISTEWVSTLFLSCCFNFTGRICSQNELIGVMSVMQRNVAAQSSDVQFGRKGHSWKGFRRLWAE